MTRLAIVMMLVGCGGMVDMTGTTDDAGPPIARVAPSERPDGGGDERHECETAARSSALLPGYKGIAAAVCGENEAATGGRCTIAGGGSPDLIETTMLTSGVACGGMSDREGATVVAMVQCCALAAGDSTVTGTAKQGEAEQ